MLFQNKCEYKTSTFTRKLQEKRGRDRKADFKSVQFL